MVTASTNSLIKSLREAGDILRGEVIEFESWRLETPPSKRRGTDKMLGVFIAEDEDFVTGKIYEVKALASGSLLATSETGESVIFGPADFLLVKFQPKAEKLIRELVAA